MAGKPGQGGRGRKGLSGEQRQWNAEFGRVAKAWKELSDEERLAWDAARRSEGLSGYNYFVKVNTRRQRDGEEPARSPPRDAPHSPSAVGKLTITNRRGRIRLALEVRRVPTVRVVVFGSPPCNRGISRYGCAPRHSARAEKEESSKQKTESRRQSPAIASWEGPPA